MDMADWYGPALRRWLLSAERFSEAAIGTPPYGEDRFPAPALPRAHCGPPAKATRRLKIRAADTGVVQQHRARVKRASSLAAQAAPGDKDLSADAIS